MAEAALASALGTAGPAPLLRWLTGQYQDRPDIEYECSKTEFVTFFISYLRNQTECILQNNANALQLMQHLSTPEKLLSQRKLNAIAGVTTETPEVVGHTSVMSTGERQRQKQSPSRERSTSSHKKPGRRVKTKLFNDNDCQAAVFRDRKPESHTNTESSETNTMGNQSIIISSTPMKNNLTNFPQLPITSPVTPTLESSRNSSKYHSHSDSSKERCDTPRMNSRNSSRMSSSEKSINLGDYITTATKVSSKKKKSFKNTSNECSDSSAKTDLDLNNADSFPEIGAKRRNQSSEKRRIKPTNIDAGASSSSKSFTMNSFTTETFQQPPILALEENVAFEQQQFQPKELSQSFDTERSILKQERQKLMEKFNTINTSSSVKIFPVTPQIKTVRMDSVEKSQTYIDADISKVNFKDKLEALVKIYNVFLRNNLILSIGAEIYFLISVVLSKQSTDDYEIIENKIHQEDNNICDFLLKSLHNCSYLAIKTLWMQRQILEVILDKTSLKLLGENKRVRAFYPDLAKFLLNLYGLKCEQEMWSGRDENSVIILESRFTNGNAVICFNSETDSVDNFPSVLSFQNFKKQRDMFYEILRWWSESAAAGGAAALRPRVKALLALAAAPANHAHLARLLTAHMMADCLTNSHESKLSKLQRRLTGPSPSPASADSHRLPRFTGREEFYRDFLTATECESFRTHARDSLASELCALDATCLPNLHEPAGSADGQARQEYLSAVKRLRLLAKFLGLLAVAPYRASFADGGGKTYTPPAAGFAPPKEKLLQSDLALRNHSQPPIDLLSILETSLEQRRLSITIPWLIQYLAMMDYTSLRIKYYKRLLCLLFRIYTTVLKANEEQSVNAMKKSTITYLKLCLGWLFEMPHFPQESFYELSFDTDVDATSAYKTDSSVDFAELIDENVLSEVCPYLKEFSVLLLTSHPSNEAKEGGSTFRHITPVTMSLSTVDRAKNKERELQARLEEEFLRGQPSSTRRVLELVADRVTSATVKELAGGVLAGARARCRERALHMVQEWQARGGEKEAALLERLRALHAAELAAARGAALGRARVAAAERAGAALRALLAAGAPAAPLEAVARRSSVARVERWLRANWSGTEVLCKDVEAEMQHLMALGAALRPPPAASAPRPPPPRLLLPAERFCAANVSAAGLIMELKELLCQLMENSAEDVDLPALLERTRLCCRADNVFITPTSRRVILQLSVELLVMLVSRKSLSMTDTLLNKFHSLWDECLPRRRRSEPADDSVQNEDYPFDPRDFSADVRLPTPVSSDDDTPKPLRIIIATDNPDAKTERVPNSRFETLDTETKTECTPNPRFDPETKTEGVPNSRLENFDSSRSQDESDVNTSKAENGEDLLDLFTRILCPRNVVILAESRCDGTVVWEAMASVLLFLVGNDYLSEDSLTEQCLAVYRQDWPQAVLERLSACMRRVSERRGRAGKFTLYLDFLAEFCGDMALEDDASL